MKQMPISSTLLQMLSSFKASRDFGNPIAKRVVFAMNRLFVKSNFFEGKKEAKRLMKEIYAEHGRVGRGRRIDDAGTLSLVDAERSIKTSSALKIIDAILDENKAAKLEMVEDVKTDALETLCGALKSTVPATRLRRHLSSSSLISKCGKHAIQLSSEVLGRS